MPFVDNEGARIYWRQHGAAGQPVLLLLNSIGTDMTVWDRCVPHLSAHFRLIRMDTRGHGASDAPRGDYDMALLARDVASVMNAAGVESARVAGVSLGAMIAMQLALDHPQRVDALGLVCTSVTMDPKAWQARIEAVRDGGMGAIAGLAMERFFAPGFADRHPEIVDGVAAELLAMDPAGYAGASAAIRDMDLLARLNRIGCPALVITGSQDVSTPADPHGDVLLNGISGAQSAQLACGHIAPLEVPLELAAALRRFFLDDADTKHAATALFEAGLVNRRRVLGDAWVDRSLENRTPFNADFQAMITRIAWHEVWGRPGLDDRTRRLMVLAITASLSRWEEFALHVRSGLEQGGFTRDELKEVLMQTAIYAGVPAANTGFAEAMKIMAELDGQEPGS
ncbi:MAG: 3-oxoadipate enol-lactonase [Erythrobacter sp.]|nr:3-oxoadipate enol-lactonase [Erythrobacter sp.]NCQ63039.1 3-oxoadipate enol-lactonase [Alphaproteobacteria bacterium]